MRSRSPAMAQDFRVIAARLFQRVPQDGQPVKGPLSIDRCGDLADGALVPGEPGARAGIDPDFVVTLPASDDVVISPGRGPFRTVVTAEFAPRLTRLPRQGHRTPRIPEDVAEKGDLDVG